MELVVVRRMLGKCKVFVRVGSCKEFVRSIQRELRAVRSLLGEVFRGIRLSWSCKEFVRRIARYSIELEL